jgi:uncharacterized protein
LDYTSRTVKIPIREIKDVPQLATFAEEVGELNGLLHHGAQDYTATSPIGVSASYYRAGMDVFVDGEIWALFQGQCSRCLAEYPFRVVRNFALVLAPANELGPEGGDHRLTADDLALSYYRGEEIDLSPLVREQTILALPTRPLCDPECRGLCPRCGASRNEEDCGCVVDAGDPRLAVFRGLKMSG